MLQKANCDFFSKDTALLMHRGKSLEQFLVKLHYLPGQQYALGKHPGRKCQDKM